MKRKKCINCSKNRLIKNYINDFDKCIECLLVYDDKFTFGKYKGIFVVNVKQVDKNYYEWCINNLNGFKDLI